MAMLLSPEIPPLRQHWFLKKSPTPGPRKSFVKRFAAAIFGGCEGKIYGDFWEEEDYGILLLLLLLLLLCLFVFLLYI